MTMPDRRAIGRRSKTKSPTARTLDYLRERGWLCWIVEKWNPHSKTRVDLFGFGDILAFRGSCVLIVQATTMDHLNERQAKIAENGVAQDWRREANRLVWAIGWRELKVKGRQKWWPCVREWTQAGEWVETATGPALTNVLRDSAALDGCTRSEEEKVK